MARPTKYKADFVKQAKKLCELGATDMQVADFFEVNVATLYRWKLAHKSFCEALRLGKDQPDNNVETALYHRAIGYSHEDTDIRVVDGQIVQTPIIKHYPPDTRAALAWLYNRRSNHWHPQPDSKDKGGIDDLINAMTQIADKLPS